MSGALRLLVVDHDPARRAGLVHTIEHSSLRAEAVECSAVSDAVALVASGEHFDCLLVDEGLPERGAFTFATLLRAGNKHLPIVFMSGTLDEDAMQQAVDAGVTDFVPKTDVSPRRLAFRVQFAIRVARAEAETAESLERANAAARARDEVLAIVSHDLRGPLHAISLASEAVRDELGTGSANRYLAAIDRAGTRAERLISDLLDASAIENGRIVLNRGTINLCTTARQAATDHELVANEAGGKIRAIVPDEPIHVSADRERILQVLANLIGNAIKHARGAQIDISVEKRDGSAVIAVADHGPGIAASELPHIFDRYWTGRTRKAGAGLGLAIAKGVVLAHGGMIQVSSRPGEGARFEIALPLAT
jgi:signal transduction histidine kinase